MNKSIGQAAPIATVSTPGFIGRLTCAIIAPDGERDDEVTGLIAHIDAWQRDVTAKAVAKALAAQAQVPVAASEDLLKAAQALLTEHEEDCLTDPMFALVEMAEDDENAEVSAMLLAALFRAVRALSAPQQHAQAALSDDLPLKIRYAMEGYGEQESIRRARAIIATYQPAPVAAAVAQGYVLNQESAPTAQQERAWYKDWLAGLDGNLTVDQIEFGRRVWAERARRAAEGGA
jgi:hypothetical protein